MVYTCTEALQNGCFFILFVCRIIDKPPSESQMDHWLDENLRFFSHWINVNSSHLRTKSLTLCMTFFGHLWRNDSRNRFIFIFSVHVIHPLFLCLHKLNGAVGGDWISYARDSFSPLWDSFQMVSSLFVKISFNIPYTLWHISLLHSLEILFHSFSNKMRGLWMKECQYGFFGRTCATIKERKKPLKNISSTLNGHVLRFHSLSAIKTLVREKSLRGWFHPFAKAFFLRHVSPVCQSTIFD